MDSCSETPPGILTCDAITFFFVKFPEGTRVQFVDYFFTTDYTDSTD